MLKNAYFLAKIGADTAENERKFAKNWQLPHGSTTLNERAMRSSGAAAQEKVEESQRVALAQIRVQRRRLGRALHGPFFLVFFRRDVLKEKPKKTKHRQMLGRRATAENAPSHNTNRRGTDLKGEGEQRHKEKLSPLPFELLVILKSAQ